MLTLLVLCSVIALHGVQGSDRLQTTVGINPVDATFPERTTGTPGPRCGDHYLQLTKHSFNSPNYPNQYPASTECKWFMQPPTGKWVYLEFTYMNLEFHPTCDYDAVYVYDGRDTSSRLLGKICGSNRATFNSTGPYLTVRFKSDGVNNLSGFRASFRTGGLTCKKHTCNYRYDVCSCVADCVSRGNCCPGYKENCEATTPATTTVGADVTYPERPTGTPGPRCGNHYFQLTRSSFNSPNYPNQYPASTECKWFMQPPTGKWVYLEFTYMNLEFHPTCDYDAVYVYDGRNTSSRLLGKICGKNRATFNSTGPYLTVRFKSDGVNNLSGFRASFRTGGLTCKKHTCNYRYDVCSCVADCVSRGNCCPGYKENCEATTPATTTTVTEYPTAATAEPSCRYYCGYHVSSCSCESSCERYGNCCYDYYYYCQATTHDMTFPTESPCVHFLSGSGTFSSPNYPNYYDDNTYCVWQLKAADDHRIFLAFMYLQLENCCSCDYIKVYDGPTVGSRYMGTVCNNSLNTFVSTSKYLTVAFHTDGSVVGRGFIAEFMSSLPSSAGRVDCSSDNMNIVIEKSYLNSLGYDTQSLYLNDARCRPMVSRYQAVFNFPVSSCGNIRKFENGRVTYTNTLRAYSSSYGDITRQSHFEMSVGCRMEQDSTAQIMYVIHHRDNSSMTGTGRFNTSMDFYTSSNFYYRVSQVPYEVTLNQNLYVQVNLRGGDSSMVLFLDTCVTAPSPYEFQTRPYYLVRNGCSVDNTYQAYSTGIRTYARFTFKAFQFMRATESVFIQCKVLICQASDSSSRCRRGCTRRTARDLGSEHNSQTLVLGPIRLKADPEKKEEETQK